MFDVGFAELFLLSLIGLLVLGPERLPAVARTLGGFMRKARHSWYNLKRTVEAEMAAAEASQSIAEAKKELETVQSEVARIGRDLNQVAAETGLETPLNDPESSVAESAPEAGATPGTVPRESDQSEPAAESEPPGQTAFDLNPAEDTATDHKNGSAGS